MSDTAAERGEVRNPAEPYFKESVNRSRLAFSGGGSGAGGFASRSESGSLPFYGTTAGETEGGEIYTEHVMLWDVDSWDDSGSLWG